MTKGNIDINAKMATAGDWLRPNHRTIRSASHDEIVRDPLFDSGYFADAPAQALSSLSARRLRSTIRLEVGNAMADSVSSWVNVRETVSIVRPR
jgi:hypothetical protein